MRKRTTRILATAAFVMAAMFAGAQSAIVPVGGDAQSTAGSVSYTVGQVAVKTVQSGGGSISVAEGVQQAYEIQTVGISDYPQIVLNAKVFPNPTENQFQLQLNGFEIPDGGMTARLFDGAGKLLQNIAVTSDETLFQIGHYATGAYLLEVLVSGRAVRTFRIIRK
ncbi:MAG: T9SS type A sorting domain-containing protein [Bacteroidales bacterium]|nr:T9SS type A sorting domain-containing protein [Bacteroidales bacterium]